MTNTRQVSFNNNVVLPILSEEVFTHRLFYHYRYFFPFFGIVARLLGSHADNRLFLISLIYLAYVVFISTTGFRHKFVSLFWRTVRINIDLLFLDFILVLEPDMFFPMALLYLIPLLTAIHYPRNRYYFLCGAWISLHAILVIALGPSPSVARANITAPGIVFFIMLCAAILYIYDTAFRTSLARISLAERFVSNIETNASPERLAGNILERIKDFSGASIAALFLNRAGGQNDDFYLLYTLGIETDDELTYLTRKQGFAGQALSQGRPVYVDDNVTNRPEYKPFRTARETMRSLLALPLIDAVGQCGVVVLEFNQPSALSEMQRATVREFSTLVTPLLRQIIVYSQEMFRFSYSENRLRGHLLALRSVAHTIRNNFTSLVQLHTYLLNTERRKWDPDIIEQTAKEMRSVCDNFEREINRCLEVKKVLCPSYERMRVGQFAEWLRSSFLLSCRQRLLRLSLRVAPGCQEDEIEVDPAWLHAIIDNIISNTVAAYRDRTESRFLDMLLATGRAPQNFSSKHMFRLEFRDAAGGISNSLASKLSDNIPGYLGQPVGEGLNIIKRLVLEMRGAILCERIAVPAGTRTVIMLPQKQPGRI